MSFQTSDESLEFLLFIPTWNEEDKEGEKNIERNVIFVLASISSISIEGENDWQEVFTSQEKKC